MPGDSPDPRDAGAPSAPSQATSLDGGRPPFWTDGKLIARARRAAQARHPIAQASSGAAGTGGRDEPAADPVEEFSRAMAEYRRVSGRMFPTWCEVLEVLRSLGYSRLGGTSAEPLAGH